MADWKRNMSVGYFLVGFLATTIGAMAGLGGGVIIKPVLDALGNFDIASIGVLSSATVLSMSTVSLVKAYFGDMHLKGKESLMLAVGSVSGGILGKILFAQSLERLGDPGLLKTIQASILVTLLFAVFISLNLKDKINVYNIENLFMTLIIGLILGTISSFLGVGGGPFNVVVLALLFSMGIKESALNSIFIIFCAQSSGLLRIYFTTGFSEYNLSMLNWMILGGVIGGFVGSFLLHRIHGRYIERIFNATLAVIIIINIYNVVS
jgi:hypothetical protein